MKCMFAEFHDEDGHFVIAYYPVTRAQVLPGGRTRLTGYWEGRPRKQTTVGAHLSVTLTPDTYERAL
jgi:hypothetical protein